MSRRSLGANQILALRILEHRGEWSGRGSQLGGFAASIRVLNSLVVRELAIKRPALGGKTFVYEITDAGRALLKDQS